MSDSETLSDIRFLVKEHYEQLQSPDGCSTGSLYEELLYSLREILGDE